MVGNKNAVEFEQASWQLYEPRNMKILFQYLSVQLNICSLRLQNEEFSQERRRPLLIH